MTIKILFIYYVDSGCTGYSWIVDEATEKRNKKLKINKNSSFDDIHQLIFNWEMTKQTGKLDSC